MKYIITSDSHKEGKEILRVVDFAKENGIETVLDAGDLHGSIHCYSGVNVFGTYWDEAEGGIKRWEFTQEMNAIGGTVVENGTVIELDDIVALMQHNLSDYEVPIAEKKWQKAIDKLNLQSEKQKLAIFGHTHSAYFEIRDGIIAINPGWLGNEGEFAVLDTDTNTVEFRKKDEVIYTIGPDSDVIQLRRFSDRHHIERLVNDNEVWVVDGKRSEDMHRIISAYFRDETEYVEFENKDGTQQLRYGDFTSKKFNEIVQNLCEEKRIAYTAKTQIDGLEKEVLVVGKDEKESIGFDRIHKIDPIMDDDITAFIGQTILDEKELATWDYNKGCRQHLVINNQIIRDYDGVSTLKRFGNELVIVTKSSGKEQVSHLDLEGKVIKQDPEYSVVSALKHDESGLIYIAKDDEHTFIVDNGKEGIKHARNGWKTSIFCYGRIQENPCYVVKNEKDHILMHGTKEIIKIETSTYDDGINTPKDIDGKLAFIAYSNGVSKVIMDGEEVASINSRIVNFDYVNGELLLKKSWQDNGQIVRADGTPTELKSFNEVNGGQK